MKSGPQMTEHGEWVKVDQPPKDTIIFSQPLLADKSWTERSSLLILAWALLLYRGSACCNDEETLGFGFRDLKPNDFPIDLRSLKIEKLVRSKTDSLSQLLITARTVVNDVSDFEDLDPEVTGLCLSNDRPHQDVDVHVTSNKLHVRLTQKPALLAANMATVYIHAFANIVKFLLCNAAATVKEAIEIGEYELSQLWLWNSVVPPKVDRCVQDLFKEEVVKRAEKVAVVSWDGQLTYSEVDRISDRLACYLIAEGVRIGDVVPLCFEKSMWTVVGVLGVLKTGAGVSLTDPSQPEARLKVIAEEVGAKVVVTSVAQGSLGEAISPSGKVIKVGSFLFDVMDNPEPEVELPATPSDSILYIIFTSGSTGKPKGVMITHANYLSGALPRAEQVGYGAHSRVLDFPSYAFDVSVDCMLCTLINGGCICVPSEEERVNDLNGAIRRMNVNMAHMTPSVARVLDADIMPSLEILGLGGESVSSMDAAEWSKLTKVVIAYGPSECTVGCTCNNQVFGDRPYTSIGKGVGGLMWIVDPDDHNQLMPIGAVGELLVEGPIVGDGYLNEPEKTAASFIHDPTWMRNAPNEKYRSGVFYKTGDLVKYDPDGSSSIVFAGRGDQQVKLRGQRVELGEIEHHLRNQMPGGVSVAVEVIKPDGKGEPLLVAFMSEKTGDTAKVSCAIVPLSPELSAALTGIEERLSDVLPRYMVPHVYISLKEIPLLVSLKTDRKKLRSLGSNMSRKDLSALTLTSVDNQKPITKAELVLCNLWQQLLGSGVEIGANDNFFDVGGDSLRAMRLVAAARKEGLQLTVLDIFKNPKLSDMAVAMSKLDEHADTTIAAFSLLPEGWDQSVACSEAAEMCNVEPNQIEDIYPCTPLQEGLMALSAKVKDAYMAQRVVDLEDMDSSRRLRAAFQQAARESPILRTRIVQIRGQGLMQVVLKKDLEWQSATTVESYLAADRESSMGLGTALCRFALVEGTDKLSMVLTIHHALYDGWSMPLVIERVNRAYHGLKTNRPAPFKSFIKHLGSMDRAASEEYWREGLQGATSLQFPIVPFPGYQHQPESLLEHHVKLPEGAHFNTSVATLIRGAWALVSSRYTASDDVVFGETLTGRNAPVVGVEQIEGPMITTVPIRVRINRDMKVSDFLDDLHNSIIERIPHEHFGLQHIRRVSADAREACELRTGLVIHPTAEYEDVGPQGHSPADGFVPAGDEEAAQEALKFNSYGLMLVFTQDSDGFLVMASFDSRMIDTDSMKRVLEELETTVQRMCQDMKQSISDLVIDDGPAAEEQWRFNNQPIDVLEAPEEEPAEFISQATAFWVVDPRDATRFTPTGAAGELLLEGPFEDSMPTMNAPTWLSSKKKSETVLLYRTNRFARYTSEGKLQVLGVAHSQDVHVSTTAERRFAGEVHNEKERLLREMWSRVLGIEKNEIGSNDGFFDLGGDSIGAMKLVSEARHEGFRLTVSLIFQNKRLDQMAAILEKADYRAKPRQQ
ncbi:Nonribosomal Peptide Synthase (NRPS), partial [Ascosphaera aggregata]